MCSELANGGVYFELTFCWMNKYLMVFYYKECLVNCATMEGAFRITGLISLTLGVFVLRLFNDGS